MLTFDAVRSLVYDNKIESDYILCRAIERGEVLKDSVDYQYIKDHFSHKNIIYTPHKWKYDPQNTKNRFFVPSYHIHLKEWGYSKPLHKIFEDIDLNEPLPQHSYLGFFTELASVNLVTEKDLLLNEGQGFWFLYHIYQYGEYAKAVYFKHLHNPKKIGVYSIFEKTIDHHINIMPGKDIKATWIHKPVDMQALIDFEGGRLI